MATEVELKLYLDKSNILSLKRQLANIANKSTSLVISPPKTQKTHSIYFDTKELTLFNHAISIRLRRVARKWTQTIKDAGSSLNGLHQRAEIENEVNAGTLDLEKIDDTVYTKIFNDLNLHGGLAPIFSTDVRRTVWQLSFANGDKVEMVLDVGELIVGNRREPICEIELELKAGNQGCLFEFALLLQQNIPLAIANMSKAQRGYAYLKPQHLTIVKARPVKLHRKMLANVALKKIVHACLIQLQGNQPMVLNGSDIEGVHQMRIALRRLRSAIKVFSGVTSEQTWSNLSNELIWITNLLGDARDLDVLVTQTLPPIITQIPNQNSLALLVKKMNQERNMAYTRVRNAINSQRYQHLLLLLGDCLENQRWNNENFDQLTVKNIAQSMLSKRYKMLKKSGKRLKYAKPKERHKARILAKKLRYLAEFFADLYPTKSTKPFINSLSQLQNQLGRLNDIAVAGGLVSKVLGQNPSYQLKKVKYFIDGWNAHSLIPCITEMNEAWKAFLQQKPFW